MREGKAEFNIANAFYRPQSRIVRDLGVLAAAVYRRETGHLRVLDGMTATGVRSLRYYLESGADWIHANDGNPDIQPVLEENLQELIQQERVKITYRHVNDILYESYTRRDYFDLVDVDAFGAPAAFLHPILIATRIGGLIYLTSTDGRSATGHQPENSLRDYNAYARSHPAAHEQGLRLILGAVQSEAAKIGLGIDPIFSLFYGETYRIMMRLTKEVKLTRENYGFLGYCHFCGEYQPVSWQKLGRETCVQDGEFITHTGPMWLGGLHDRAYLSKMLDLAIEWNWTKPSELLTILSEEIGFPPYFYRLKEIGRRGKLDVPKRSRLIETLQNHGYRAARTHIDPQGIKTTASLSLCIALSRS